MPVIAKVMKSSHFNNLVGTVPAQLRQVRERIIIRDPVHFCFLCAKIYKNAKMDTSPAAPFADTSFLISFVNIFI